MQYDGTTKQLPQTGKRRQTAQNRSGKVPFSVNFTEEEHARFLTMYEQSGLLSKAQFIKVRVFDATFRVIKKDRGTMEYAARQTSFNAQFRKIGVNYNQVVKTLLTHFSRRTALVMLYKLENETRNLVAVGEKIIALAEEFRQRW